MSNVIIPLHLPSKTVAPTDLICILSGTKVVKMEGFGTSQSISPWKSQTIRMVNPSAPDSKLIAELKSQSRKSWLVLGFCMFAVVAGLCIAAATFAMLSKKPMALAPIKWNVTSISNTGLAIRANEKSISIPIGAHMPNGDVLTATSVEENSFTTNSGTTKLERK